MPPQPFGKPNLLNNSSRIVHLILLLAVLHMMPILLGNVAMTTMDPSIHLHFDSPTLWIT